MVSSRIGQDRAVEPRNVVGLSEKLLLVPLKGEQLIHGMVNHAYAGVAFGVTNRIKIDLTRQTESQHAANAFRERPNKFGLVFNRHIYATADCRMGVDG